MAHEDTAREIVEGGPTIFGRRSAEHYEAAITAALQAAEAEARERALCQANDVQTGTEPSPEEALQFDGFADAWQPMDTAPRNHYQTVLVVIGLPDGGYDHRIAMWDPENDDWTVFMANWDAEPLLWAPLPQIPQREIEEERSDDEATAASEDACLTPKSAAIRSTDHG